MKISTYLKSAAYRDVSTKGAKKQAGQIFRNDDWVVVAPKTPAAVKKYSTHAKWDIAHDPEMLKDFLEQGYKIIFLVNRNDDDNKFAISIQGNVWGYYDAKDNKVNESAVANELGTLWITIKKSIKTYLTSSN